MTRDEQQTLHVQGNELCPVLIGTSGYSYTEWVDSGFYPQGTRTPDMLPLYACSFPIVELNYTWYQMVRAEAISRMIARAPESFRFAAKLTRTLTHERERDWRQELKLYREGIKPLQKQLAAILIQLPPGFNWSRNNRYYLAHLLDSLHGFPLAVEFRHVSWARDSVFAELVQRKVTLVTVDAPPVPGLFPCLDIVTNPELFFVRFHGRNMQGWQSGNMQKKFDYCYSEEELKEWNQRYLQSLRSRSRRGIVFFNNHVRAQAPGNAKTLQKLLQQ
ncbi:MAG TPA: DUF72 domain-containing protein [Desulfocapsa sulfexigens]|nr:DUF72 domain-containing protein [Desulfocapsa sulfexigens]